ncbi:hypothetical protein [Amycolatopsis sp. NPDC051071]|uniref:hypothetical protein n=1 Tax=Amycolatopsis sp. NPDC051071 TaxID=3154637 RepID=UPI00342DA9C0
MDGLEDKLRGIRLAEPPLGFDPDKIAVTARKQRNRRAVALTGVATLAVIAAAVAFAAPGGPAVSPAAPAPVVPAGPSPSTVLPPVSPKVNLEARKAGITGHLMAVLPNVLTGAKDIQVRSVDQLRGWDILIAMVAYRDASGPGRSLVVTISGTEATKLGFSLEDSCKPGRKAVTGLDADIAGVTSGEPVDCVKLPQADGSTVVVTGTVPSLPPGDVDPGRGATVFRADGTSVSVHAGAGDGGPRPADEQLIRLVKDPEFTLG